MHIGFVYLIQTKNYLTMKVVSSQYKKWHQCCKNPEIMDSIEIKIYFS
jgi:hypothetical protein